jgi:hypothetical protein
MDLTPFVWIGVGCLLWHWRGKLKRATEVAYDPDTDFVTGPYVGPPHPTGWATDGETFKAWRASIHPGPRKRRRRRG